MSLKAAFMVPHPPMIIPQVGKGSEAQIQRTIDAYEEVGKQISGLKPETIVITSPHATMYADYFSISSGKGASGSFARFRASRVAFEETYDEELVAQICMLADASVFPAGTLGQRDKSLDHGTMVPLWFIRKYYDGGMIIRIGLSGLPLSEHYALGQIIKQAADDLDRDIVFVASGDLSHKLQSYGPYGRSDEGPVYDKRIMDVCGRGAFGELFDFDEDFCEKAAECGHRSFVIMAGALDGMAVKATALSHEDVTGVGYGICTFYPEGEDPDRYFLGQFLKKQKEIINAKRAAEDPYVRLARYTLEKYIRSGITPDLKEFPEDIPEEMINKKAGTFVSLHKHGKLRGCIGTISPAYGSVAQEIIQNAVSASTKDPRFDPVTPDELDWIEISVDVLGEPEYIDGPGELDVKKYGVIVSSGFKRGLLLPDLDGVDTVEQQISIAKQKAGIKSGEHIRLQRFEVIRHF